MNHQFLDLVAAPPAGWNFASRMGLSAEVCGQIAPLSASQKRAAASCPYALFDLRFHDEDHWPARLRTDHWNVADDAPPDEPTQNFVRQAVFLAWSTASTGTLPMQLLLGMTEVTAAAFRSVTIDRVLSVAATEAVHLTARWNDYPAYWSALIGAAGRPDAAALRRIQLHGLQLAAAARLRPEPREV